MFELWVYIHSDFCLIKFIGIVVQLRILGESKVSYVIIWIVFWYTLVMNFDPCRRYEFCFVWTLYLPSLPGKRLTEIVLASSPLPSYICLATLNYG